MNTNELINYIVDTFKENKFDVIYKNSKEYLKILKNKNNPEKFIESCFHFALFLRKINKIQDAINILRKLILLDKKNYFYFFHIGKSYQDMHDYNNAIKFFDKAIKLNANFIEAYNSKGVSLINIKEYNQAITSLKKILKIDPSHLLANNNIGKAYLELGKFDGAIKYYSNVLLKDPKNHFANFGISIAFLTIGNFDKGWKHYKYRLNGLLISDEFKKNFNKPLLNALNSIKNKKILVVHEQGLGDTIQFCRYLKLLLEQGANVIFLTQPSLYKLISSIDKRVKVIYNFKQVTNYDYYCPLIDLPKIFKSNINNIPSFNSYLGSNIRDMAKWKSKIDKKKFNIGICWEGSDKDKSIPIEFFKRLSKIKNVNLISLQKNENFKLRDTKKNFNLICFDNLDQNNDFDDTAHIMKLVDLVITCDTSICHLAASMGVKVWVLLKKIPDWRWMMHTKISNWYPSMELYRQKIDGKWKDVFDEVEINLLKIL